MLLLWLARRTFFIGRSECLWCDARFVCVLDSCFLRQETFSPHCLTLDRWINGDMSRPKKWHGNAVMD